jgi:ribonuclease P protein subunit RPR2
MEKKDNKLAKERIALLFRHAEDAAKKGDFARSKRYVNIARNIGMKTRQPIPKEFKRRFCKKCGVYWLPPKTVRIRSQRKEKRLVFTCLACGTLQRYHYNKEQKG